MKNSINIIFAGILALASVSALNSCSEWVELKSIELKTPTLEEQNSELYAAYIQGLNDYKAGEHKVMMVTFDNFTRIPLNQSQHLTALPDSIDYVSLNTPHDLVPAMLDEMQEVRKKGTKVIYNVDFPTFEKEWDALARKDATLTEDDALAYLASRTSEMLALCDKYGYDGITFTYTGRAPAGLVGNALAVYSARQSAFLDLVSTWCVAHADKSISFIGNPHFLIKNEIMDNQAILQQCNYIILPTELASSVEALELAAGAAVDGGSPDDRFVFRQYMFDAADKEQGNGYFSITDQVGNKLHSIPIAATWMNRPTLGSKRLGMMILGVQQDYFQSSPTWFVTRQAIATMNP
jgi:hypothetical protein